MQKLKIYFMNKDFLGNFSLGMSFLFFSLYVQYLAGNYVTRAVSEPVTDIILSNTRVYNVDGIFVYGAIFLILFVLFLCLQNPKYFPFVSKSVATFTLIRSAFISLTHISPFPNHIIITSSFWSGEIFNGIFNGNDLFFSGHTGMPFLLALIFWKNKTLRFIFLELSMMFAVVVLLGHLHYSIDVFAAYFITYSIFHICQLLFKKDWELFSN